VVEVKPPVDNQRRRLPHIYCVYAVTVCM